MDLIAEGILEDAKALFCRLEAIPEGDRVDVINEIRLALREHSPMKAEPVDCVLWVPADDVHGNDYNPNIVAPPELKLLERSIDADGFTQPIVSWPVEAGFEVVDGFHRHKIGKESKKISERVLGRLPVTVINGDRTALEDRQAATIRHNRARGLHTVDGMVAIVLDLARRGKGDAWIAAELGMDADEVLRLRQQGGLAEMFAHQEFNEAWEADAWAGQGRADAPGSDE
jgi:ParB-like chromosome segregation protein Spo0J